MRWYDKARSLLKANNMTYKDVADVLDVSEGAAGHYLKGRREPRIEQIRLIARLLGLSMSELVGEDHYFLIDTLEKQLIDKYRALDEREQETALRLLESLKPRDED